MPPKSDRYPNPENPQPETFKERLEKILNRPLTPENVEVYADTALEDVIRLTDELRKEYENSGGQTSNPQEVEDTAYTQHGLGSVPTVLDHIIKVDARIKSLDAIIASVDKHPLPKIITPPDAARAIINGEGDWKNPEFIHRLKVFLFVLENEFDLDLNDPNQVTITSGILRNNMMRSESYYLIQTPTLNRNSLVCNEEGNATFVFDDKKLELLNIPPDQFTNLTKEEMKALIGADRKVGQWIPYSDRFVPDIIDALREIGGQQLGGNISFLVPKVPDDYLSMTGMEKKWGVSWDAIKRTVDALGSQLGVVADYSFKNRVAPGFSPSQQDLIREKLQERIALPDMPAGYLTVSGMKQVWESQGKPVERTIRLAVDRLGVRLGTVDKFLVNHQVSTGFSPEQQALIYEEIYGNKAPDGYLSKTRLVHELNSDPRTIDKIIDQMSPQLGNVESYKDEGGRLVPMFSPLQQAVIKDELNAKRKIA